MARQTKYKLIIEAHNKTKKAFSAVGKGLGKIGGFAKSAAKGVAVLGAAVIGATAAFIALGAKAFNSLDDIGKTAGRTGLAAEQLQALQLAAVESGGSVEGLNKAMEKFTKNIGDVVVKGTGEAKYALDEMGISIRNASGEIKPTGQLLEEVSDGLSRMGSESEKNSALQSLFGREGIKFNQVLAEGVEGLDKWATEATTLGFIVKSDVIKSVESFNDRFAELQFMMGGFVKQTFGALAPGLDRLIKDFKAWTVETINAKGGLERIGTVIAQTIVTGLIDFIGVIGEAGTAVTNFAIKTENAITNIQIKWLEFKDLFSFIGDYEVEKNPLLSITLNAIKKSSDAAAEGLDILGEKIRKLKEGIKTPIDVSSWEETANRIRALLTEPFQPLLDIDTDPLEEIIVTVRKRAVDGITIIKETTDAVTTSFSDLGASANVAGETIEKIAKPLLNFSKISEQVALTMARGFTTAFMDIENGLKSMEALAKQILSMIINEIIKLHIIAPIMTAVGFPLAGMASGGTARAGKPYIVGEAGPELFLPGQTGTVVPNASMRSTNVNITYDIKSWDSRDTLAAITEQAPNIVGIIHNEFRRRGMAVL